jgi:hypothetical protein
MPTVSTHLEKSIRAVGSEGCGLAEYKCDRTHVKKLGVSY